jgi:hypothetical protein
MALCLASGVKAQAADPSPDLDVPADDPSVPVLRRVQVRAGILGTQAWPQSERQALAPLSAAGTAADSAWLRSALPAFRSPAFGWSDPARGNSFFFEPEAEAELRMGGDSGDARIAGLGGRIYGRFGAHLSYFSHARIFSEFTDKAQFTHQFSPELGETYSVEKGAGDSLLPDRSYNRFESYIVADWPWIRLKAGRDRLHMGPGYFTSLTASRETPPYYLLEARVDFAPWLTLDDYLLRMTDTDHEIRKYANLHRFEFKPSRAWTFAFQDIVIYQDRDPDARYVLPLVPIMFSEVNNGGLDNSAMSLDFAFAGFRSLRVWGEIFIDDLLGPASFFDDFWENRWAGLAGFQAVLPARWADADLVMEYGHVEPWTYNGRKSQTSFKHFNVPSASRLGPDSRTWDTQLSWRPARWLELRERFSWTDKGLGRPGALGAIHNDSLDGQTKSFLGGDVESHRIWETAARFVWSQFLSASLTWTFEAEASRSHRVSAWAGASW